jgi:hypothetical protein
MIFPTSFLQSLLALYGLAPRPRTTRRRPAPVLIGSQSPRWR